MQQTETPFIGLPLFESMTLPYTRRPATMFKSADACSRAVSAPPRWPAR